MRSGGQRGAKALTARDWLFGSRPRRLVLRFVLDNEPPKEGWTKTDIAKGCGLSRNGGATDHIRGLVALDLLDEDDGRYRIGPLDGALFARVAALVDELEHVPDLRIDEVLEGKRRGSGP
ncbi:MAG: hypothetical protein ACRDKU_04340 [Gaiellaceae bacterium]